MSQRERLGRLVEIAAMVRDARAARLARIAAERDTLKDQLKALDAPGGEEGLVPAAAAMVRFDYETWASRRRADLNLRIAAKHAEWLAQLDDSRRAFGRAQVLDRLHQAQKDRTRD